MRTKSTTRLTRKSLVGPSPYSSRFYSFSSFTRAQNMLTLIWNVFLIRYSSKDNVAYYIMRVEKEAKGEKEKVKEYKKLGNKLRK